MTCFSLQLLHGCYDRSLDAQVLFFGCSWHFSGMWIEKETGGHSHNELGFS